MIFDTVSNRNKYFSSPVFDDVFTELYKYDHFADGKESVYIKNDLFIKRVVYSNITSDWITESHLAFIDIQIIMEGEELIKVYTEQDLIIKTPYNSNDDIIFYDTEDALTKQATSLYLRPGYMAIFMPQDAHMTQIQVNPERSHVKKIVIKVAEKYFQGY